jgi:outer membrane protein
MHGVKLFTGAAVSVLLLALAAPTPALADTIEAALVRAYQNNPQLNAQRAQARSTDENVPQALSGYRPKVNVTLGTGYQYQDIQAQQNPTPPSPKSISGLLQPNSASLTVNQTLYNGNQTANRTRAAESQVSGSREALRVLEQTVLLQAATTYMDFLRDSATLEVQRSNVRVLEQTLKQTRDRFNVGEVTRTDVAQSEAQLAAGKTQALTAESNLTTTRANFRRIIGNEPTNLAPGSPVDRFLPATLASAVGLSLVENPSVTASMFGIDVNYLQVKINEGALLPTVTVQAGLSTSYQQTLNVFRTNTASAIATASIPIYQGGAEYSLIRQSKENLAQQRLNLETTRDQTRANVVQAWGQLEAGKAQVQSAQAQVTAS